ADEPTGRYQVVQADAALAVGTHVLQRAAACPELLHDGTLVYLGHIHGQPLPGLLALAVDFSDDDLRTGDAELIAFAAHILDQDGEMQLTAPGDAQLVRILGLRYPQGDVVLEL